MQSNAKSNSIITSRIPEDADMIEVICSIPARMVFTVLDEGDVELNLARISAANLGRALIHGFNQRIPDGAAIGLTDADGNIIPRGERNRIKKERMNDLCIHYESGTADWSRVGSGGGGKSLTIEALARVKDETYESAEERVDEFAARKHGGDRAKARAVLRKAADVAAAMKAIRAERDSAKALDVSADDMLNAE